MLIAMTCNFHIQQTTTFNANPFQKTVFQLPRPGGAFIAFRGARHLLVSKALANFEFEVNKLVNPLGSKVLENMGKIEARGRRACTCLIFGENETLLPIR